MKVVGDRIYFAVGAEKDVLPPLQEAYQRARQLLRAHLQGPVPPHQVVKVDRTLTCVSLLEYAEFQTSPHPTLVGGWSISLVGGIPKYRRGSPGNPSILHRLEMFLAKNDHRIPALRALTEQEEAAGAFLPDTRHLIGRKQYWNALCQRLGLEDSMVR